MLFCPVGSYGEVYHGDWNGTVSIQYLLHKFGILYH